MYYAVMKLCETTKSHVLASYLYQWSVMLLIIDYYARDDDIAK